MITVVGLLKEPRGRLEQGERHFWHELGTTYLNRWLAGVRRYVPDLARIVLLTDRTVARPELATAPLWLDSPGWWSKLEMFRPGLLSGRCLYLDLDNVLSGPLDALCALTPDPLIMADDVAFPGLPNGSTILFDADRCRLIWDAYAPQTDRVRAQFDEAHWPVASDQAFIASLFPNPPLFQRALEPGFLLSSKQLEAGADWSRTHLVFGQGTPKPHESSHPFYRTHWT